MTKEISLDIKSGVLHYGDDTMSIPELRNLCLTGKLQNIPHSMMVQRLIQYGFDLDELRDFYVIDALRPNP